MSGGEHRRFAVTGGRDFTNWHQMVFALRQLPADLTMVSGECPTGLDEMAKDWWHGIHERAYEGHPADWHAHGKAAGPVRNQQMVDSGIDFVIVFDGGRGTADMHRRCVAAGVRVLDMRRAS